jgi:hypothetical protein
MFNAIKGKKKGLGSKLKNTPLGVLAEMKVFNPFDENISADEALSKVNSGAVGNLNAEIAGVLYKLLQEKPGLQKDVSEFLSNKPFSNNYSNEFKQLFLDKLTPNAVVKGGGDSKWWHKWSARGEISKGLADITQTGATLKELENITSMYPGETSAKKRQKYKDDYDYRSKVVQTTWRVDSEPLWNNEKHDADHAKSTMSTSDAIIRTVDGKETSTGEKLPDGLKIEKIKKGEYIGTGFNPKTGRTMMSYVVTKDNKTYSLFVPDSKVTQAFELSDHVRKTFLNSPYFKEKSITFTSNGRKVSIKLRRGDGTGQYEFLRGSYKNEEGKLQEVWENIDNLLDYGYASLGNSMTESAQPQSKLSYNYME